LNYIGEYTFHNDYKFIELEPKSSKTIYIKTKKVKETVSLEFEILNYVIAPKTNLKIVKTITID
ncbi:MAG: Sb-PDE family phosphodiesterase, partial [Flavobacteriaceae bacterium]|nr:Sb-PDE family phosphodiesterase [Flavobacteriaceae bacterium]